MIYHKEKLDWAKLIRSGKVWENYFGPFEWREKDYGNELKKNLFCFNFDKLIFFFFFIQKNFDQNMLMY
jgi:hypothetical protein